MATLPFGPVFTSLSDQIAIHARFRARKPALVEGGRSVDWATYNATANRIGNRLVQAGVPILTVKELAGHKTLAMTLRYAHLAPNNLTNAIAAIDSNGYDLQNPSHGNLVTDL